MLTTSSILEAIPQWCLDCLCSWFESRTSLIRTVYNDWV